MEIVITGYGRLGRAVEQQAKALNIGLAHIVDNTKELAAISWTRDMTVIDFSDAQAFQQNLEIYAQNSLQVICGTTGWYAELSSVQEIVNKADMGFLYGANFAIGVHLFWLIARYSAQVVNAFSEFDVYIHEEHHRNKKDAPSGTALRSGEILLEQLARKDKLVYQAPLRALEADELCISSARGGHVFGSHSIKYDSLEDHIELRHDAKSISGFAYGSLQAAKWLQNKKGFFSIEDFINDHIKNFI